MLTAPLGAASATAASPATRTLSSFFSDPTGSGLVYKVTGSPYANATISGAGVLTVTELDPGRAKAIQQRMAAYAKDAGIPGSAHPSTRMHWAACGSRSVGAPWATG